MDTHTTASTYEKRTGNLLVIGTGYTDLQPQGSFMWGSRFIGQSKVVVAKTVSLQTLPKGLLYFTKPEYKERKALHLRFTALQRTETSFRVEYCREAELSYTSYEVKHALKKLLRAATVYDLPYCVEVDEQQLMEALETEHMATLFRLYTEKCQWETILKCAEECGPIETTRLWHEPALLQYVAFAMAKLSECTVNVRKLYPNESERKAFIAQKRRYREEAIRLRQRVRELEPENPTHTANLAYSHYLSAFELTIPGGRRDGDAEKEAYTALAYYTKVLEVAPQRISDAYRAGQLLARILPRILLYSQHDPETRTTRVEQANNCRTQGIDILENAIAWFEKISDEKLKARMEKYYVKALYILSHAYLQRGKCTFLVAEKALRPNCQQPLPKQRFLELALQTIDRCILGDAQGEKDQTKVIEKNGWLCGVFKAYTKGLIHLYLFALTTDEKQRKKAYDHLQQALEISFPKTLKKQNRLFVLEKLAVLSLLTGNSSAAVQYLEPHYKRNEKAMPEYCASTLAVAYILQENYAEAEKICTQVLQKNNSLMAAKFEQLRDYLRKVHDAVEFELSEEEGIEEDENT